MSQLAIQQNQIVDEIIPPPIGFTEAAARKVWELIEEEGNPNLMLRVYITGGGCSGFQYGFTFEETQNADDTVIEKCFKKNAANDEEGDDESSEGGGIVCVKLLVDPMSFQYLAGAEIDYEKKLQAEQFVIRNPNAKTTCGCGSSFAA
jgi:iron-sulfur cluster insertion protein